MVNFNHRFLPGLAGYLHPLHEACKERGQAITWSDDCQIAFDNAKSAIASAALLNTPPMDANSLLLWMLQILLLAVP